MPLKPTQTTLVTCIVTLCAGYFAGPVMLDRDVPLPQPVATSAAPVSAAPSAVSKTSAQQSKDELEYWITLFNTGLPSEQAAAVLTASGITNVRTIRELLANEHRWPNNVSNHLIPKLLMARWAKLDAAGAVEYASRHRITDLPEIIASYAKTNPTEAREVILRLSPGEHRTMAWRSLCLAELPDHPDRVWAMLDAGPMRDTEKSSYARETVIAAMVKRDPAAVEAKFGTMTSFVLKSARAAVAQQYFSKDNEAGWAWIQQQPRPQELAGKVLSSLFAKQPDKAVAYLSSLTERQIESLDVRDKDRWVTSNPDAFVQSLTAAEVPDEKRRAIASLIFWDTLWTHPEKTEALAPFLETASLRSRIFYAVDSHANHSPVYLETFMNKLPPGMVKDLAEAHLKKVSP